MKMVMGNSGSSEFAGHIHVLNDPKTGLKGVIVLHSTTLGPAAGGCRFWQYANEASAHSDAFRLAEGMAYKNAMAGLPLGGGKAVLMAPSKPFDRDDLFRAFGRAVEGLDGAYITAEDVGTTVGDMEHVAEYTRHVAGLNKQPGRPGGDPSPFTARGVFSAMEVAASLHLGKSLSSCVVAIQGCGNVGSALAVLLRDAGAKLIISDANADTAARVSSLVGGAKIVEGDAIFAAKADIFAPCALGGVLNSRTIPALKSKIVCGAANNQLATPEDGKRLADRCVLYAPDYVVNAGGIINVAGEYLGWTPNEVAIRIEAIGGRLTEVISTAEYLKVTPVQAANQLARSAMGAGRDEVRKVA
jgi:leucine dehydrogenase